MAKENINPTILILSSNKKNGDLLKEFLRSNIEAESKIKIITSSSVEDADKYITKNLANICYSIIDLSNLNSDVWSLCQKFRGNNIEFLLLSSVEVPDGRSLVAKSGAVDLLIKPLKKKELLNIIKGLKS